VKSLEDNIRPLFIAVSQILKNQHAYFSNPALNGNNVVA